MLVADGGHFSLTDVTFFYFYCISAVFYYTLAAILVPLTPVRTSEVVVEVRGISSIRRRPIDGEESPDLRIVAALNTPNIRDFAAPTVRCLEAAGTSESEYP